jgi:molybdopterin molybdotransferase
MLTCDEAVQIILRTVNPLAPVECVLDDALGRVLAEPVAARWDLPPADNSAMDGFAFAFAGQGAGAELALTGFIPAGGWMEGPVPPGMAVRIMTGAPLPAGCDTVVPLEDVTELADGIRLQRAPQVGQHIRLRGEELRRDEIVLHSGTPLFAAELGLLAAVGAERVWVHPAPRVALLSTGDELVELGQAPGPGQIVNSNAHLLAARLREEGCAVFSLGIAGDTPAELAACLRRGLEADLLISTGGVSAGDRDYVQAGLHDLGFTLGFWKVAIKPGKPVLFGTVGDCPVFGLPGNPAASAATFELFVRPALRRLAGHAAPLHPRLRAVLSAPISGGEKRQRFLWGTLEAEAGRYVFNPSPRQSSGQNSAMQEARALLPVPGGSDALAAGREVEVLLLRMPPGRPLPLL